MQTFFSQEQLRSVEFKRSNDILRACVHCGFCTATCPTYQVLGDELDSPRGRIYLIKDMLENNRTPDVATVKHIDRCLSCLACMTTCPSSVHYMHLVDHARSYIEENYKRPMGERVLRFLLAELLPYPMRFRLALLAAKITRPVLRHFPDARIRAMAGMVPQKIPPVSRNDDAQSFKPLNKKTKRVILMTGCAQKALNTDINDATIRLLTRFGCEVVIAKGQGCCGAITHHMGKTKKSHRFAEANVQAWSEEIRVGGIDAIIVNTSGCGTTIKDYWHMLNETQYSECAKTISARTMDITEFLMTLDLPECTPNGVKVAYHAACSLQHGQKVTAYPKILLQKAGFKVFEPRDAHLCCGSAGTYNLLQPEISSELKARKVKTIEAINPDIIAAGNLGCMMQIGSASKLPIVHTVELIDWAQGGPMPSTISEYNFKIGDI